jgi:predicted amidohydrolase YtcJ
MKWRFTVAAALFCLGCHSSPRSGSLPADLILVNGNLITLTAEMPRASAMAIRGGTIVAVGDAEAVAGYRGSSTRIIDLQGKTATPGLIDAHMHFSRLGARKRFLFLDQAKSADEVVEIVARTVKATDSEQWVRGSGWHTVGWTNKEFPHHRSLSAVSADNPVYLAGMANHAAWVNKKAMDIAGITRETPDPPDGRILKDADGEPTGVLLEGAKALVSKHLPKKDRAQLKRDIEESVRTAVAFGLTEVHDAGVGEEEVAIYKELLAEGKLKLRLRVMLYVPEPGPAFDAVILRGPEKFGDFLSVDAIKVYADGALGARGAALLAPYADRPGEKGLVANDREALYQIMDTATKRGFQVAVHAIGDRGNRNVLDTVERIQGEVGSTIRARIEHAQVIHSEDIPRFAELDVIASMQPIHCTMDKGFAVERLGPTRMAGAYAWASLLASGAHVAAGADTPAFPLHYSSPLWGMHAAITRQDKEGQPEGGFFAKERVTWKQALEMYTVHGAYAAFSEARKGRLAPGMVADVTIFEGDPSKIVPKELLTMKVANTIVAGQIVYSSDSGS